MRILGIALSGAIFAMGCASHPATNPVGQAFPRVEGKSLSGKEVVIPDDFSGQASLIVIGYKQKSQFDIDRWLLGLSTKKLGIPVYEVPSVVGFIPSLFSNGIDDGMRRGIPQEDWSNVVTIYNDADKVAQFTGNDNGIVGRVVLLDAAGRVQFFHDRGFSVGALERLSQVVADLSQKSIAARGQER